MNYSLDLSKACITNNWDGTVKIATDNVVIYRAKIKDDGSIDVFSYNDETPVMTVINIKYYDTE